MFRFLLLSSTLLLSGRALAVDLVNKDQASYRVVVTVQGGPTAQMVEIGPRETKTGLCPTGTCRFTLDGESKQATGDDRLVIKDGKLKKAVKETPIPG